MLLLRITLMLTYIHVNAEVSPGFVKLVQPNQKNGLQDEHIKGENGTSQGKFEETDGTFQRYYAEDGNSKSNFRYYVNLWGYPALAESGNVESLNRPRTQPLLSVETVPALEDNKFTSEPFPPKHVLETTSGKLNENQVVIVNLNEHQEQPYIQMPSQSQFVIEDQPYNRDQVTDFEEKELIKPEETLQYAKIHLGQLQSDGADFSTINIQQNKLKQGENLEELETDISTNARSNNQQNLQQSQYKLGGFETKTSTLGRKKSADDVPINSNRYKLIKTAQNLVSGKDVLNINGAMEGAVESLFKNTDTIDQTSLINEPIVVADFDDEIISSTENTLTKEQASELSATARPLSTPITENPHIEDYEVKIQKSVPLYLGKFEYQQNTSNLGTFEQAAEDIQLGKTLLAFSEPVSTEATKLSRDLLQASITGNFIGADSLVKKSKKKQNLVPFVQKRVTERVADNLKINKSHDTNYVNLPYSLYESAVHAISYPTEGKTVYKQPLSAPIKLFPELHIQETLNKNIDNHKQIPQNLNKYLSIDRTVQKPLHYIDNNMYSIQVGVPIPIPQAYTYSHQSTKNPRQQKEINQNVPLTKTYNSQQQPLSLIQLQQNLFDQRATQSNVDLRSLLILNGDLAHAQKNNQYNSLGNNNFYYVIPSKQYLQLPSVRFTQNDESIKYRTSRSNDKFNPKIEYGFLPPLRPSQEIDEYGNPITREKP